MHFAHLVNTLLKDEKSERNFAKYSPIKKFTDRFNNKLFLIWLLTAPLHVKYVATLPCNLSLMTCTDINVSRGSQHMQGATGCLIPI